MSSIKITKPVDGLAFARRDGVTIGSVQRLSERIAGRFLPVWKFTPTTASGLQGIRARSRADLVEAIARAV